MLLALNNMKGLDLILNMSKGEEVEKKTTLTVSTAQEKTSEQSMTTERITSLLTDTDEIVMKTETQVSDSSQLMKTLTTMTFGKTTEQTSTETFITTLTTQMTAATTVEERQVLTENNEWIQFLNIALFCACFLLICVCIILIFFIYKSNKRKFKKILNGSNMKKVLFSPGSKARQIAVGLSRESKSQRRKSHEICDQGRSQIIEGGFSWSSLVNYSKQLHLRTMKPAGLPPIQKKPNGTMRTSIEGVVTMTELDNRMPTVS